MSGSALPTRKEFKSSYPEQSAFCPAPYFRIDSNNTFIIGNNNNFYGGGGSSSFLAPSAQQHKLSPPSTDQLVAQVRFEFFKLLFILPKNIGCSSLKKLDFL